MYIIGKLLVKNTVWGSGLSSDLKASVLYYCCLLLHREIRTCKYFCCLCNCNVPESEVKPCN